MSPGSRAASARKSWAGTTLDERRAARRAKLLDAGLELMGTAGSAAVAVRAVCRRAGLTERYFYEQFDNREVLLVAVYRHVAEQAQAALLAAVRETPLDDPPVRARVVVEAFVELMIDDPRRGRVLLVEALTEPVLVAQGVAVLPSFAALVREHLPPAPRSRSAHRPDLAAVGMVGALSHLFQAWLAGSVTVSRDQLVEHAVGVVLAHVALADPSATTG